MSERVSYHVEDGVATIAMDDGKVNVLSPAMFEELSAAVDKAEADGAVVLLRGRPGMFSAGFDLKVFQAGGVPVVDMLRAGFEFSERLLSFPTPVVIECTGHAIAMAAFVLLSGDYRIGADGPYRIQANEVAIGLTLPRAATEICRHRLSPPAFDRATIVADPFTMHEAVGAGFLDRVVGTPSWPMRPVRSRPILRPSTWRPTPPRSCACGLRRWRRSARGSKPTTPSSEP